MFIEERHQHILELIQSKGRVEVSELSKDFQISEDSIRRDLRLMEEKGLLTRTYGGAILPEQVSSVLSYRERQEINVEGKTAIAKLAVSFIKNNDTILLDGSSTVAEMVPFLNHISGLTIITNSIAIAHDVLHFTTHCQLIMIGGTVERESFNTISIDSLKTIQSLTVDKTFTGPCSISPEWGLSTTTFDEAAVKRAMIETAREVYVLAESNKFGHRSLANIGPLMPQYHFITDGITPGIENVFQQLVDKGIQVEVVDFEKGGE
jgi:DeoR/GlpR family transcriptional regulator of sugar metabolism